MRAVSVWFSFVGLVSSSLLLGTALSNDPKAAAHSDAAVGAAAAAAAAADHTARRLQRTAGICTENPTPFSTSLYVSHIGDGTPFTKEDGDALLLIALEAWNEVDAQFCDTTYRTLNGVNVHDIYYTESLDFIRLRYDVTGSCKGCLVSDEQLSSGIGPVFGGAEFLNGAPQGQTTPAQSPTLPQTAPAQAPTLPPVTNIGTATVTIVNNGQTTSGQTNSNNGSTNVGGGATVTVISGNTGGGRRQRKQRALKSSKTPFHDQPRRQRGIKGKYHDMDDSESRKRRKLQFDDSEALLRLKSSGKGKGGKAEGTYQVDEYQQGQEQTSLQQQPVSTAQAQTSPPQQQQPTSTQQAQTSAPQQQQQQQQTSATQQPQQTSSSQQQQVQNVPSSCGCYNENANAGRGPTEAEYATVFNRMIAEAKAAGTLSGIAYVEDIFEAGVAGQSTVVARDEIRQVESTCDVSDNQDFSTTVWVELTGSELTADEILPMEVAVVETYNEMKLVSCDLPEFRKVSQAKFRESRPSGTGSWYLKFEVAGKCVNCDAPNTLMFATDAGESGVAEFQPPAPSRLLSEIDRLTENRFLVRPVAATCVCPLNDDNLPYRSPTTGEYSTILQGSVDILKNQGMLPSVKQVVEVTEGDLTGVCTTEELVFYSSVFADFDGTPNLLEPEEILTLEGGFKETYNQLIFEGCDEYFRTVQEVRLIPGVSRRRRNQLRSRYLQGTTGNAANSSDVVNLQSELPSVYMVTGRCRGCPRSESGSFNMYDDGFRRRKLSLPGQQDEVYACYSYSSALKMTPEFMKIETSITSKTSEEAEKSVVVRRLQECVCAPGEVPDAPFAPTTDAFITDYNVKIAEYVNAGLVRNINSVLALQEVPPYLVGVGFSVFYGSLKRMGTPSNETYAALVDQTSKFYRNRLQDHYDANTGALLRSVTITRESSTPRPELDMLQVDFMAELIFDDTATMPPEEDVILLMESFDYVEYIVEYLWMIDSSNPFRTVHTVRFTGREAAVVDIALSFKLPDNRIGAEPSKSDRQVLSDKIDLFFQDVFSGAGIDVLIFSSIIDAEDIAMSDDGQLMLDFGATITFSKETEAPSQDQVISIIRSADLEKFRTQYLGQTWGTGIFNSATEISFFNKR